VTCRHGRYQKNPCGDILNVKGIFYVASKNGTQNDRTAKNIGAKTKKIVWIIEH